MTKNRKRGTALLVAPLLVLSSLGTAAGAHHCPHHDGAAAGVATAPASHGPAASHDHDAAAGDAEAHGPCTCMGECQVGAAPSLAAPTIEAELPSPPASPHPFVPAAPDGRASIVPFSLPWGNAPPTL